MKKTINNSLIIYSDGLNFKILTDTNVVDARPKKTLKALDLFPVVGDYVDVEIYDSKNSYDLNLITKVYSRKNYFLRPNVANIDLAIIISSTKSPNFDFFLLLKQIAIIQSKKIIPVIFFNKIDLLDNILFLKLKEYFDYFNQKQFLTLVFSNDKTNELKTYNFDFLNKKIVLILGQSGAGKSTIINSFNSLYNISIDIKTQAISKKLNRGKHTTRHFQAYLFPNFMLIDTPGFSSFDLEINKLTLSKYFLDFETLSQDCKFYNCLHLNEPNCKIKENYKNSKNLIDQEVYEIYKKMIEKLEI